MKICIRKTVNDNLKKYDPLATNDDFIEVTEWSNEEGWDICLHDKLISLTRGQLDAINYLVNGLNYEKSQ